MPEFFPPLRQRHHALVVAANRGNAHVFETLFERCQPKIFAIALRFTRVREDAEDIIQQTFQKALDLKTNCRDGEEIDGDEL